MNYYHNDDDKRAGRVDLWTNVFAWGLLIIFAILMARWVIGV